MGSPQPVSSDRGDLADDPRWQLVLRTVASPSFRRSARLRDFLLYVGEAAVRGKTEDLTEHHIGCAVFGRRESYSPADDNTVRVHARQLRFRLEEHFRNDGRDEPLIIEIPKGTYVPAFTPRALGAVEGSAVEPDPVATPVPRSPHYLWIACAALVLLGGVLGYQNWRLRQSPAAARAEMRPGPLLAAVCDPNRTTTVVVPDSGFGTIQSILGKRLSLEDYLNPGYPEVLASPSATANERRWLNGLARRPYTTFAILLAASRLSRIAEREHWNLAFRFARDIQVRDLNEGNVILLGSAMSNPWVSLFEEEMGFRSGWDQQLAVPYFQNTHPQPGEPAYYPAGDKNGIPGAAYALVSLMVNPKSASSRGSRVLILEGVNMEGTEAAVDFVCDPDRAGKMMPKEQSDLVAGGGLSYRVEVLLRTKAMAGAARGVELVATRTARMDAR